MTCLLWSGICCGCLHGKVMRQVLALFSFCLMALYSGIWAVYGSFTCRGGCSFSYGSWCALFTTIAWFVTGTILCCTPSSHHNDADSKKEAAPVAAASAPAEGESNVSVDKVEMKTDQSLQRRQLPIPMAARLSRKLPRLPWSMQWLTRKYRDTE